MRSHDKIMPMRWLEGERERTYAEHPDWDPDVMAWIEPMSAEAAEWMLGCDTNDDDDGRSEFLWIRLPNGDLFCGFIPYGDSYTEYEGERQI